MRIHYLQHEPFEGLGSMEAWFRGRGDAIAATHLYRGDALPDLTDFDWLVLMGGGMSVNDEAELPWLVAEKALVRRAIAAEKRVLGVCLGAQLIASALGAKVYKNATKEIGWWKLSREPGATGHPLGAALPDGAEVFHWHGETFDLPPGGVRLARSEACLNQAVAVGPRVLGLQFHLETTEASARELIAGSAGDLRNPGAFVQTPEAMLAQPLRFAALNAQMARVLETLAAS
ncbi:MAG TPA: type 1 glutamine amidotransferase [Opitutaceae bacterium]|nr:type 1 glutamine amidotransferase [Opitutaceae bacterium]